MSTIEARHCWHDAGGLRHAISLTTYPLPPRPGEDIDTLCGLRVTLTRQDCPRLAEYRRHKTTCLDCDAVWRRRDGIPGRVGDA
ncbi:MAG: zinc finger protein [Umezawaea sp.]